MTLRRLLLAAEGKQTFGWELQSAMMCLTANLNTPKGKKKSKPEDFNPFAKRRKKPKTKKSVMLELAATAGLKPEQLADLERRLAEKEKRNGKEETKSNRENFRKKNPCGSEFHSGRKNSLKQQFKINFKQ